MDGATQQVVIVVGLIVAISAALAFAVRSFRSSRGWPSIDVADELSLDEAAKFAQRHTATEDLPLARVISRGNTQEGVVAWFANSISKWIPAGATRVTRNQLRRYLKWARAVQ